MASPSIQKPHARGWRIGLTGGMGAGKSTVLAVFAEAGWATQNTDAVVRLLLDTSDEVQNLLKERWGEAVILPDGSANRPLIGKHVFGDTDALQWLESVLHPRVREQWLLLFNEAAERPLVVEIPLLFEKNLENHFDLTVCLSISEAVQLQRLAHRGVDASTARQRFARQMPTADKVRRADWVLTNDGDSDFLKSQVHTLLQRLCPEFSASKL